jgi:hypothetical protein
LSLVGTTVAALSFVYAIATTLPSCFTARELIAGVKEMSDQLRDTSLVANGKIFILKSSFLPRLNRQLLRLSLAS